MRLFKIDDGEHHDHLVDISSGKVVEFYDEVIEQLNSFSSFHSEVSL
jgi:Fe2+ or Zn2+ uptake regulation protein